MQYWLKCYQDWKKLNPNAGFDQRVEMKKKFRELCNNSSEVSCLDVISYDVSVKIKEEENMRTETQVQRDYLENRLTRMGVGKEAELMNAFHITDEYPKSLTEAVKRIREGAFKLITDEEMKARVKYDGDYFNNYTLASIIDWRTQEADKEGFDAAKAELKKASKEVLDVIKIMPVEQGLEALKAFEAKTFH